MRASRPSPVHPFPHFPPRLKDPLERDKKPLPYKSYDEIPEEVIEEAEQIEQRCTDSSTMSVYYDCECWAMRFLEQRLIRGPEVSQNSVMMDIGTECPNTPAIAGYAYNTCIHQGISTFPSGQDPEEYCECVGNSYAKLYERSGQTLTSSLIVKMKTISALSCTKQPPGVPVLVPPIK